MNNDLTMCTFLVKTRLVFLFSFSKSKKCCARIIVDGGGIGLMPTRDFFCDHVDSFVVVACIRPQERVKTFKSELLKIIIFGTNCYQLFLSLHDV